MQLRIQDSAYGASFFGLNARTHHLASNQEINHENVILISQFLAERTCAAFNTAEYGSLCSPKALLHLLLVPTELLLQSPPSKLFNALTAEHFDIFV